jgi:hypothetical protein
MFKRPDQMQEKVFYQYFQTNCMRFWHPMFGFDIIKFDNLMKSKFGYVEDDKTSLKDFLTQKFGEGASSLINSFLSQ